MDYQTLHVNSVGKKDSMKKILLVTDAWYPQINGVVRVFEKIMGELEKKGYTFIIISPSLFKTVPLPTYKEIRISLFPKKKIKEILEKEKPDFIHIATEGSLGIATRNLCKKRGLPFTTSYHTRFTDYVHLRLNMISPNTVYKYLGWFHNAAQHTMVNTKSMEDELRQYKITKLVQWPLGVDTGLFIKNEKAKKLKNLKKPIFTYLGRLAIEKNVEDFLRLELPGSKLIIGDGPDKKKLEEKYKKNTFFVGYKQGQDIVDLLSLSDVFVFPSITETFGLVIVEALACSVPVAAYDVQGPKDIITNGFDGFIGPDLGKNALNCLEIKKTHCRETALKYSWENSAECFLRNLVPIK
ncbi:MAG: glycosyltransferase family 1 protein [Candidatus Woesearchaeota archaeon]|nr:MAG: glycosyltransferase family 1 protein [Candidatus Woesearchaeota archaeon]